MKLLALIVVLIAVSATTVSSFACDRKSTRPVKTYVIDLDKPGKDRFKETSIDFKPQIGALIDAQKKMLNLTKPVIDLIENVASKIDDYFPHPYNDELKGIAEATNYNLGDVIVANMIYDVTAFCTSIVVTQQNGQIIHGRNLDYNFPSYLQDLAYLAEFRQNGTVVFRSAQIAGFIGILSGHKYKKFTFSINERDQGYWWVNLIYALLELTQNDVVPLSILTREVLEKANSFDEAVSVLTTHRLIAPAYFIVGGMKPNEGVVITRDQSKAIDTWKLDGGKTWYLLETNYDHWVPPPPNDDRRTPGMKAMNTTTQAHINPDTLLDVLTISPVCNKMTVYTVLMSAAVDGDDAFQIIIR